jgi:hypothetical protein
MTDILVIFYYEENSIIHYRCNGTGDKYKLFYSEWIPNSSYKCTGEDFPWDYFIFTDPTDHVKLMQDFPDCVFED